MFEQSIQTLASSKKCVKKFVQKQYKYTTVKVCQKVESKPREVDKWKVFEKRKKLFFFHKVGLILWLPNFFL